MDLLKRIDQRLADRRDRIDPSEFEDCATSILTSIYPGLVPIVGGTDHGLDAEITSLETGSTGLIITSSRDLKGARASLRSSLDSVRRHDLPVRRVAVANLAEMNRRRRDGLIALAEGLGFELVQVFDRSFFANKFREQPDWRRRVLGIAGGAFCLSREPRGSRPDDRLLPSVGRDELLEELVGTGGDAVLCGLPGSGKSHVAARLPGALFMEDRPTAERLLDDLITARPQAVIVDDAGGRLDELDRLLYARRTEDLSFRIVVTCWPHQFDEVFDHLPGVRRFDVELLTREEMGRLLRARGITRLSVLAQILHQAQGRPAWALNLADLLIRAGDWKSVWTGSAVRSEILGYLRRSGASPIALELLTTIAMLGEVDEDQAHRLGRLLEIPRVDLRRTVESVAVAGLLDVTRVRVPRSEGPVNTGTYEDRYKVEPQVVAASIVADGYFAGHAAAVSLTELRAEFPEKQAQLLQAQIHCALLGADEPINPSNDEIRGVLADGNARDRDAELLRSYALLGLDQARFVIDLLAERARAAWALGTSAQAEGDARMLAERVADLVHGGNGGTSSEGVYVLLHLLTDLAQDGFAYHETLSTLVDELRDARSGDAPEAADVLRLAATMAATPQWPADPTSTSVWLALAAEILVPTFDGNYMSPERSREFVLQSFTWSGHDLVALFEALEPVLDRLVREGQERDADLLLGLLEKWATLAQGHSLPFGGQATAEQVDAASRVANALALLLKPTIHRPGLRARFNAIARPFAVQIDEPDKLFATLTAERDIKEDWRTRAQRADEELTAVLAPYLQQPPAVLMSWIATNDADLQMAGPTHGAVGQVMRKLANESAVGTWLSGALQHGLSQHAELLIEATVYRDAMDLPMAATLLGDQNGRAALVAAVMRHEVHEKLLRMVVDRLTVDDLAGIDMSMAVGHAPEEKLRLLFTHVDPAVRGAAAALWAADASLDPTIDAGDPGSHPLWVEAIAEFRVPSVLEDYHQGEALKLMARTAPDIYVDLLATYAEAVDTYTDFREWSESIRELTPEQRHGLWSRVATTRCARELFWATAAGSAEWITTAFERNAVQIEPDRLLHAWRCQNGPGIPFEELARLFMDRGVEPDGLLWLLEVGSHTGEDHEQYARHLERCRVLAASDVPDLARLGVRGVEVYEPRLAEARKRARAAEVRGMLA